MYAVRQRVFTSRLATTVPSISMQHSCCHCMLLHPACCRKRKHCKFREASFQLFQVHKLPFVCPHCWLICDLDIWFIVYNKTNQRIYNKRTVKYGNSYDRTQSSAKIYGLRRMKSSIRIPHLYVFRNHPFQNTSIRIIYVQI